MSPLPERQPRGGVGTAELLFRGQGEESRTLSPRSESDLLSTPFLPKNTFLAKSPREEGDPFPGKAAGGAAAALAPPEPGPGRRGARAAPYPACPPLLPCLSLNGRRGRHFESEERRRRRRRRRQGEGRMGGRGPAQPHRQAAGPGPQPPERGGEDIREGADPRPPYRSAAPPPPQGLFRPSLPSTGGGGGEGEGREEGGREGRREGEDGALGPVPGRGRGGERAGSSAVPGLEPKPAARDGSELAPERSPPSSSRSLDPGVAARPLAHSLSRPLDSAAAPPLQLRLSQELPQRPDVTAPPPPPPPPQTRGEEGGEGGRERRRGCGACAGQGRALSRAAFRLAGWRADAAWRCRELGRGTSVRKRYFRSARISNLCKGSQ